MRTQVEWKCLRLLSIILPCQPVTSVQKALLCAVPHALLRRGLQQMKKQPSSDSRWLPWHNETGHGAAVPGALLAVTGLISHAAGVAPCPSCNRGWGAGLRPGAAQLRAACWWHLPSVTALITFPPSWGTFGSYLNRAPVNPMEKTGRIPFRPPSFFCALPLLLKSLSGVQSGETPYYTFSALRKASISLTRS